MSAEIRKTDNPGKKSLPEKSNLLAAHERVLKPVRRVHKPSGKGRLKKIISAKEPSSSPTNFVVPYEFIQRLIAKPNKRNPSAFAKAYQEQTQGMPMDVRLQYAAIIVQGAQQIAAIEGLTLSSSSDTDQATRNRERSSKANRKFLEQMTTQSKAARAKDVKEGRLLPAVQVWTRLNISKQAVSKAVKENRMFTLDGPSGESLYPAFFTDEHYNRRALEKVSKALGNIPGPSKWQFFTTGKGSLAGRTPLDALAAGKVEEVLVTAVGFVER